MKTNQEALQEEIARREAAASAQELELRKKPLPESPSVYDGKPNVHSNKTLEKLRGLSQNLSAQLAEVRNAHVIKITTMATELVDVLNETVQELERELAKKEKELTYYRNWEDSREVAELVERVKVLEEDKEVLAGRLAGALLGR